MALVPTNLPRRLRIGVFVAMALSAQTTMAAWNAGNFMRFGVGARALGMGSAFVAIADDATAVYWNPACLMRGSSLQFYASYADRFGVGIHDQSLGVVLPTDKRIRIGFSVLRTSVDDINRAVQADENGRPIIDGTFSDAESAYMMAIGIRIHRIFAVGLTSKLLIHQLDGWTEDGLGFDLGFLLTPIDAVSLGLNVQNLNRPRLRWSTPDHPYDNVTSNVKAGCAVFLLDRRLTLSADVDDFESSRLALRMGTEIRPIRSLVLRSGLYGNDFATGASVEWRRFRLDYALHTHELGDTHLFTLEFGL